MPKRFQCEDARHDSGTCGKHARAAKTVPSLAQTGDRLLDLVGAALAGTTVNNACVVPVPRLLLLQKLRTVLPT